MAGRGTDETLQRDGSRLRAARDRADGAPLHVVRRRICGRRQGEARHPCDDACADGRRHADRSEEHTSELQSLMRISYAVFCLKKKNATMTTTTSITPYTWIIDSYS